MQQHQYSRPAFIFYFSTKVKVFYPQNCRPPFGRRFSQQNTIIKVLFGNKMNTARRRRGILVVFDFKVEILLFRDRKFDLFGKNKGNVFSEHFGLDSTKK